MASGCDTPQLASVYLKCASFSPAQGGTLALLPADVGPHDSAASALVGTAIAVPPHALNGAQIICIGISTEVVAPAGTVPAGPVAVFDPDGLEFAHPVTMELPLFDAGETGGEAGGLAVGALESTGLFRALPVGTRSGGRVSFQASSFTSFGAFFLAGCDAGAACDGGCANLVVDPGNCGACGHRCDAGEVCAVGQCVALSDGGDGGDAGPCRAGFAHCDGGCVDTTVDPANCGSCGNVCPSGACAPGTDGQGACQCELPDVLCPDFITATFTCIDPNTSLTFCGGCATTPDGGVNCNNLNGFSLAEIASGVPNVCVAGQCACGPTQTGTICPDGCQYTDSDPNNCGGCSAADNRYVCGEPTTACQSGQCVCPKGGLLCGADAGLPECIDETRDAQNCGGCGIACSAFAMGATCELANCGCFANFGAEALCAVPPGDGTRPSCNCDGQSTVNSNSCSEPVRFARDLYPLLRQTTGSFGCAASGCHAGARPAAGLAFDLDAGAVYGVLLGLQPRTSDAGPPPFCDGGGAPPGQSSAVCGCRSLVEPGPGNTGANDPTKQSYLYSVLANRTLCAAGLPMPIDADGGWLPLSPCSLQLVEQWIQQGAVP